MGRIMIRCNMCMWQGEEKDLILEEDQEEMCPQCLLIGYLMDIDEEME